MDSSKFDPYNQNVTLYDRNHAKIIIPLPTLQSFLRYDEILCINYATQLGASLVLTVILPLLTRQEKRTTFVFVLNVLALLFNDLRLLFQILHLTTPLEEIYPYFAYDYTNIGKGAFIISVVAIISETCLVICIEISLALQVQTVFSTLRRRKRQALVLLSSSISLAPIIFRMIITVENIKEVLEVSDWTDYLEWLEVAALIAFSVSICIFSGVFVAKLGYAIFLQRKMGIRNCRPMKVIFVCGCQTLIVPVIIIILQFFIDVPEIGSNTTTLVTISLPLSSVWAGIALEGRSAQTGVQFRTLWRKLTFSRADLGDPMTTELNAPSPENCPSAPNTRCCYSPNHRGFDESTFSNGISVHRNISQSSTHEFQQPV